MLNEKIEGWKAPAAEIVKFMSETVADQTAKIFGRFAQFAEKGSIVFLLAAGATFVSMGIALTFHSESLLEKEFNLLIATQTQAIQQAQNESRSAAVSANNSPPEQHEESSSALAGPRAPAVEAPSTALLTTVPLALLVGGMALMMVASVTSLFSFKWRFNAYLEEKRIAIEALRVDAEVRKAGIKAIEEGGKTGAKVIDTANKGVTEIVITPGQSQGGPATHSIEPPKGGA